MIVTAFQKLVLILSVCTSALVSHAFGNGGGYHYGVKFTGTIAPFTAVGTENVQILDEKLDIELRRNDAKVSVTYQMQNITDKKVKVKFGFPVEDVEDSWNIIELNQEIKKTNEPRYTREYEVRINGKKVKHIYVSEPFGANKKKSVKPFKGSEILAGIKGWMVTEMKLKAKGKYTLSITYLSDYDEAESSVSDDTFVDALRFRYRLSTGAVWHGPIQKGVVRVILTDQVAARGVKMEKPVNRFKKEGEHYVWRFENLEPTLADDITVQAIPGSSSFTTYGERLNDTVINYTQIGKKWYLNVSDYTIKASSTLADENGISYKADNLKSPWESSWSEGAKGNGVGESLTINLKKPTQIEAISLINGYDKNEELFEMNSRVKELEVTINGRVKEVFKLADNSHTMRYYLKYKKPISSLKLTIKSVYTGQKFEDTCLSYVGLLKRLSKEPKQYGAR